MTYGSFDFTMTKQDRMKYQEHIGLLLLAESGMVYCNSINLLSSYPSIPLQTCYMLDKLFLATINTRKVGKLWGKCEVSCYDIILSHSVAVFVN